MFSKLNRIGAKRCKVQITIHLKALKILENRDDISFLFIEFEKGTNKSVCGARKAWPEDSLNVLYNDPLTMVITLYQDKHGKYLEKKGKIVLKGHSKVLNADVKLGTSALSLHDLSSDYEKQNISFQFLNSKGKNVGSISTEILAKYLGEGGDDDASSVMSGASLQSFQSVSRSDVLQGLGSGSALHNENRVGKFHHSEESRISTVNTAKHQDYQAEFGLQSKAKTNSSNSFSESSIHIEEKIDENDKKYPTKRKTMKEMKAEEKIARLDNQEKTITPLNTNTNKTETSNCPIIETGKEILSLQSKLRESLTYQNQLENEFQNKITSMIERIIEIEDERDLEHYNHQEQIVKLLKAAKIYDKSQYDVNNSENNLKLTDSWVKLIINK